MGSRGPMPKPADQRRRRNAKPAARTVSGPTSPAADGGWLPVTQEAWRVYWASPVSRLTLDVDAPSIGRLFAMYDQHARSMEVVRVALVVKGSTGQIRANPLAEHAMKLESAILRLENELGLTPAARTRLGIELPREEQAVVPAASAPSRYANLKVV